VFTEKWVEIFSAFIYQITLFFLSAAQKSENRKDMKTRLFLGERGGF